MRKLDVSLTKRLATKPPCADLVALQEFIPGNTPFLKSFKDLLKKIFVYDPAHRITAKQALAHPWFKETAHPDDGTEAAKIRMERLRNQSLHSATRSVHG